MKYVIHGRPDRNIERLLKDLQGSGSVSPTVIDSARIKSEAEMLFPCQTWRDPIEHSLLTQGELECFAGHLMAWERIATDTMNPGGIVVEDDAEIVSIEGLSRVVKEVEESNLDLVYLGGKPMEEVAEGFPYTYWTVGYWVSPAAASLLSAAVIRGAIVPVDEFLPYHYGRGPVRRILHCQHKQLGLKVDRADPFVVVPAARDDGGTHHSVSPSAFKVSPVVVATDRDKAKETLESYERNGFTDVTVLGEDSESWSTEGRGGMEKVRLWQDHLKPVGDYKRRTVWLFSDGYDVRVHVNEADLLKRFAEMDCDILVSGEETCWPDESLADDFPAPVGSGRGRYPCSGLWMATDEAARALLIIDDPLVESDDDQEWLQRRILGTKFRVRIDDEGYVFANLNQKNQPVTMNRGHPYVANTGCYPAIIHANGPSSFEDLDKMAAPPEGVDFSVSEGARSSCHLVCRDIVTVPFFTEEQALTLARIGIGSDGWKALKGDNVPGDELRLREIGLFETIEEALKSQLKHRLPTVWPTAGWKGAKDLFLIRYELGRQPGIRNHEDISYISGSVKLMPAEKGGVLVFPRQGFSDEHVPVGHLIIWPSQVTHPHGVTPVEKGKRVSLVVWT